jgi:hypothetical protein
MTNFLRPIAIILLTVSAFGETRAQESPDEPRGFRKDKLFTGGSIALGFSGNSFQTGLSPVFGYSLTHWADVGVSVNYNYVSYRNIYFNSNDKIRRSTYGGGAFARLYPVNFLFAHIQYEHNFINEKYIPGDGSQTTKGKLDANSLLLGIGLSTERFPESGRPFFYLSLLADVLNQPSSPYTSATGTVRPFFRAGIQVPLFQGRR